MSNASTQSDESKGCKEGSVMGEWQPIETAPDDAGDYLLYCNDTQEQMVGFRIAPGEYQFAAVRGPGQVHTKVVCNPTHWMPLPEPPEAP